MKTRRILSMMTAMAMVAASAVSMQASAADAFATGDVDMDGVITGHDTALVSRAVTEDLSILSEEQIALADMNGDGEVTNEDATAIHAEEVYYLGDLERRILLSHTYADGTVEYSATIGSAWLIMEYDACISAGLTVEVSQVDWNLMDVNADGKVSFEDAYDLLVALTDASAGGHFFQEGIYYLNGANVLYGYEDLVSGDIVTPTYPEGTDMGIYNRVYNAACAGNV